MSDPVAALADPAATESVSDNVAFVLGANFVSPTAAIAAIVEAVVDKNPYKWAGEQVAGDWEAVKKAASAAGNLGRFGASVGDNMRAEWTQVDQTWNGNAAAAAAAHFGRLATQIEATQIDFAEIERALLNIGNSMDNLGRALGDILQEITDWGLIYWANKLIAAASPDPTGISRGAALTMMAVAAAKMYLKINSMMSIVAAAYMSISASVGVIQGLASNWPNALPTLSTGSYDHRGV